jgi:hypothetical protein
MALRAGLTAAVITIGAAMVFSQAGPALHAAPTPTMIGHSSPPASSAEAHPETQLIVLQVVGGESSWTADDPVSVQSPPVGRTRVLSGVVSYAAGDGAPWSLGVTPRHLDGLVLEPACTHLGGIPGDVAIVNTGPTVIASGDRVELCSSPQGRSGGSFHVTLDVVGVPPPDASVEVLFDS